MDYQLTPLEKLDYMVECFKTITQVLELASAKEGGGGADENLTYHVVCTSSSFSKKNTF